VYGQGTLRELAKISPSEVAQRELLSLGCATVLSFNRNISDRVWDEVWMAEGMGFPVFTGPNLVRLANNPSRISKVLSTETPVVLIKALCRRPYEVGGELLQKLYDKFYSSEGLSSIDSAICLCTGLLGADEVRSFLSRVLEAPSSDLWSLSENGGGIIKKDVFEVVVAKYEVLSDLEIAEISGACPWGEDLQSDLSRLNTWRGIAQLIDYRPGLIEVGLSDEKYWYLYTAMAMSRHLFEPEANELFDRVARLTGEKRAAVTKLTLEFLGDNPNVSHRTKSKAYALLADEWNEQFRKSAVRELELADLVGGAENSEPWGSGEKVLPKCVSEYIEKRGVDKFPAFQYDYPPEPGDASTLAAMQICDEFSGELDRLGGEGWRLFLGLLPGWSQSLPDLLSVVRTSLP